MHTSILMLLGTIILQNFSYLCELNILLLDAVHAVWAASPQFNIAASIITLDTSVRKHTL